RRSKLEPCRGQTATHSSASQSPSQSGPSSCEQRSSSAYSEPPQLKTPIESEGSTSTILIEPGGSSASGAPSTSGKVEALPLVRQRRCLRAVERDLEHAEAEDRALEPDRRQRDPDLLEQLVLAQPGDLGRSPPAHELGQHRGRRLRDR